jgi:uncharacterized protein YidB (DUF937 family)
MGLLGTLINLAESSGNTNTASPVQTSLLEHVMGMASNPQTGGLNGLLETLKAGGLQSAVASWVGNGPNQAVSASQIQSALGSGQIQQIAAKFGLPADQLSSHLAQILPEVIHHLTPNGTVPPNAEVQAAVGMLKSKLFG